MTDYPFNDKITELTENLELPERTEDVAHAVKDQITSQDGYRHKFTSFGGFDALIATTVFIAAKQTRVPLPSDQIVNTVENTETFSTSKHFNQKKLKKLSREYRRNLDLEPVFLNSNDFLTYYIKQVNPENLKQEDLENLMSVSSVAIRYTYKEVVENLTGIDTTNKALTDVDITTNSFGYHGDNFKEFAHHLLEEADSTGKSPQALAAAVIYIAAKVI